MEVDYAAQYKLLAACLVSGLFFGFACDCIRAFRMIVPHPKFIIAVEDFIFCILCACVLVLDFFNFSRGYLRLFALVAAGLSFLAWRLTVSRLTSRILESLKRFFAPKLKKALSSLAFAIDFLRKKVYTDYIIGEFRAEARRGFGLYRRRRSINVRTKLP